MNSFEDTSKDSMQIHQFAEQAYLDYSMYVILDRALPHIADGLKPVQRRIIYAMSELGLKSTAKYKKSARTIGDVLGKFHPHSDTACYEAMVLMAQAFSYRYTLIDGQGNWGSIDDPKSFAAMRYTEARLTAYAQTLLSEINQGTCAWVNNFDATLKEPERLPARLPNVLLNGASGIAVGMATDIPPHNLKEVANACIALLKKPSTSIEDLCEIIKGPDFPYAGVLISNKSDLLKIYKTGKGSLKLRAAYHIEKSQIIITQLPYQVSSTKVMLQIAEQINNKKLPMISDLQDQSDELAPVRIVITLKNSKNNAKQIMSHLFLTTDLQKQYRVNLNIIGLNNKPKVLNLKEILSEWLIFRQITVEKRLNHQLKNIQDRLHLVDGLLIAYLNLDEVIAIIRESDDAKNELIKKFDLSETQATAILNIRLRQLAKLEQLVLENEKKELKAIEKELIDILSNDKKVKQLLIKEIKNDSNLYGDGRRTEICTDFLEAEEIQLSASSETVSIILSKQGWIKQAKGEIADTSKLSFKSHDELLQIITGKSNNTLCIFDKHGKVYNLDINNIPSSRGQGDPLTKFIKPVTQTKFNHICLLKLTQRLFLLQSNGYGFIISSDKLLCKNKSGKNIVSISENSELLPPLILNTDSFVAIVSSEGRLLITTTKEIPRLNKGKGSIIFKIPKNKRENNDEILTHLIELAENQSIKIIAGKRTLTLKPSDWQLFIGNKGARGQLLPRGFRNINNIGLINKDD